MKALKVDDYVAVLFTCIGRRVSLLESFRRAAGELGLRACFCGTDTTRWSPALQRCDRAFLVEPVTNARYIDQLLSIVRSHSVKLLVPTIDLDLLSLAENRKRFEDLGCRVLVSDPEVIDLCRDKRRTFGFLRKKGFDTPTTMSVRSALAADRRGELKWPCFLKRWDGSASLDNALVRDRKELQFFAKRIPNAICQEFVQGIEHTCDVYIDFDRRVQCVVPRRRIEVRAGEVSKSRVAKNPLMMDQARRVVELLGAGPGVVTLQLFLTDAGRIKFTEVNPRFGGGVPLSIQAGADFPRWILQELTGQPPQIEFDGFADGLLMLRYDAEVWCNESDLKGAKVDV
ncbi:MAG TPA: ATP-grasp domain-containing protein [Sedimentisphaerales bacterium]|jgi:carbamoyl-phosphate synthase large subunit|nr:ATP-grasp domain-containing protein [Sedimentisphaerales bacterium]HNU30347.1 ATP-grasp domain-containing protein [Sedimentisphaerales bacterium]